MTVDTAGKRLKQARLRKEITVPEAAHATKVRAERIADLENDDYTNFPSMAYAKGFLLIYAKFLSVDISDFVAGWENVSPVSMGDYEYLNNAPERIPTQVRSSSAMPVWPLFVAILLVVLAAGVAYFVMTLKRLGSVVAVPPRIESVEPAQAPPTPAPVVAMPSPSTSAPLAIPLAASPLTGAFSDTDALTLAALPAVAVAAQSPRIEASPPVKQLTLHPLKKAWVKVRKDSPDSVPVFEDWLYPGERGLSFSGTKFWIELGDPSAVEVMKDGIVVRYAGPGIPIE